MSETAARPPLELAPFVTDPLIWGSHGGTDINRWCFKLVFGCVCGHLTSEDSPFFWLDPEKDEEASSF